VREELEAEAVAEFSADLAATHLYHDVTYFFNFQDMHSATVIYIYIYIFTIVRCPKQFKI